MSVFAIYSTILFFITSIHVIILRWFSLEYVYDNPSRMWSSPFSFIVTGLLLILTIIIAKFVSKPFDAILKTLEENQRKATDKEIKTCLHCAKNLTRITLTANFLGFVVGQTFVIINGITQGRYEFIPLRVLFVIAQAFSFGGISALTTINCTNRFLMHKLAKLNISSIGSLRQEKTMNISTSISMVFAITTYFLVINLLTVPFGILLKVQDGTFSGDLLSAFTGKALSCFFISVILCLLSFVPIISSLSFNIKSTQKSIEGIVENGDLSSKINIKTTNDLGILTSTINSLFKKLSDMIDELRTETSTVDKSALEITAASHEASVNLLQMTSRFNEINVNSRNQNSLIYQADENILKLADNVNTVKTHVEQQAETMQDISSSINQITENIFSVNDTARQAQLVSEQLSEKSELGNNSVKNAVESMKEIQLVSEEVKNLSFVIEDVSERTNLLAINAAIEASHAGKYGIGFAVVADEVRKLALSTSQSTHNVQEKIEEMSEKITAGVNAITTAGQAFDDITRDILKNAALVKNISDAMESQSSSADKTQKNTVEIVNAVHAIQELAEKETENAEKLRAFMQTVIEATKSTEQAVNESSLATQALQNTMQQVDKASESNKTVVQNITKYIQSFKTSND
ncbi:MAG: hypothetical protein J5505_05540 [Spirochaetaceae bacterium]|nr:hypothetical protein [Spirochaetaceae bacterium]